MDEQVPRVNRGAELFKLLMTLALPFAVTLFLRLAPEGAERFYPRCLFNAATGLYCPGCGTLRALNALGEAGPSVGLSVQPVFVPIGAPAGGLHERDFSTEGGDRQMGAVTPIVVQSGVAGGGNCRCDLGGEEPFSDIATGG